jgi:hypothetical protein
MDRLARPPAEGLSLALKSIGVFLVFGSVMAALAGVTLVWPGTPLDRMWRLNARAYAQLVPLGRAAGMPFLLLGYALAVASVGWFKLRIWGWRIAVAVIGIQVLGDVVNIFLKHFVEGAVGVAIAGALLLYLLKAEVKDIFMDSGRDRQRTT